MGNGTMCRVGVQYACVLQVLMGAAVGRADTVTDLSASAEASAGLVASPPGRVVRDPSELADLSDLSDLAGLSGGHAPKLNTANVDERSQTNPPAAAMRASAGSGSSRDLTPGFSQKASSTPTAVLADPPAQRGPLRDFLDESGATSVFMGVKARLNQFSDSNEAEASYGAGGTHASGVPEHARTDGGYRSDGLGPARSADEIRRDSVRASVLLALLIDEILPWVIGVGALVLGVRVVQAFARRQTLRRRAHRSRSRSRSRSTPGSGHL